MRAVFTYNGVAFTYGGNVFYYDIPDSGRRIFSSTVLETAFKDILERITMADAVYMNRPKAHPQQKSFIVVNVLGNISDMMTYGKCRVRIAMFAKDVADFKNHVLLDQMQSDVLGGMPTSWEVADSAGTLKASYEIDDAPTTLADVPDDFGFHQRTITYEVIIKVL